MMKTITTCLPLLLAVLASISNAKRGYLLTVPREMQAGAKEEACLTLHDIDFMIHMRVELQKPSGAALSSSREVFLDGHGHCFQVTVPSMEEIGGEKVILIVEGIAMGGGAPDYTFTNNKTLTVKKSNLITFIQPDKPIYKPGQLVQFRILSVKPDLTPKIENIAKVWIEDANGVRVTQWNSIPNQQGLSSLSLQLSEEPVLGEWKIKADIDGSVVKQEFKVEEYVLPKYEITIDIPTYVTVNAETVDATICAKYTYGQPVKGLMIATVCILQKYHYGPPRHRPCVILKNEINGCTDIKANATELRMSDTHWSLYGTIVQVTAEVTEKATGVVLNTTVSHTKIQRTIMSIALAKYSPDYFKPGLQYHGMGIALKPDGSPAVGERIALDMHNYQTQLKYEQNVTTKKKKVPTATLR